MYRIKTLSTLPLALSMLPASALAASFYYNQVGYDADQPISIIVKSESSLDGAEFKLMQNGNEVQKGTLSKGTNPDNWLNSGNFYTATLPKGVAAGTYKLQISENSQPQESGEFKVEEKALAKNTLASVLDYFYNDRAENPTIKEWDSNLHIYNSEERKDVHGGWYDASGDVSKYLSHLSYANYLNPQQIPLTTWALAFTAERIPALLSSTSTKAKTSDEAVYGADFLLRMLSKDDFFYMTVFDVWGAPFEKRELCAFTGSDGKKSADYQTAFREGGGMAIAALARASMLKVKGDSTSEQYLAGAERAYKHLSAKQSIGGNCEYCDDHKENIIDDYTALLAATELYAASKKEDYLADARKRAKHLAERVSTDGYFWSDDAKSRPFWHASDAGLPLIALVRFLEVESEVDLAACPDAVDCIPAYSEELLAAKKAVETHYNWLMSITNKVDNPFGYARQTYKTQGNIKDGFFIPHDNESNYWWQGEDARIASLAAAALYAHRILEKDSSESVNKYATDQLDWILGKNPYATCMMYKKGIKNPVIYDGQSEYDATLEGGIANGISGKNTDGSGIAWDDDGVQAVGFDPEKEAWNNWRWVEQWLPHSTWYLMALTVRYDEVKQKIPALPEIPEPIIEPADTSSKDTITTPGNEDDAIPTLTRALPQFNVNLHGRTLDISVNGRITGNVQIFDLQGKAVVSTKLTRSTMQIALPSNMNGIYLVKVGKFGIKKIAVK